MNLCSLVSGQEQWVNRLKWDGLPGFQNLRWTPLDDPASPGITGAFYKTNKNFAFYWILKAGHMVRHWLIFDNSVHTKVFNMRCMVRTVKVF